MSNWNQYKGDWERALDEAGVYDRDARRTLLSFFRKINTLQNMYERMSWSRLQGSRQFEEAGDMAIEIENYYLDEYNATLRAAGLATSRGVNIGNYLA